jgi:pimeloyl-ACP methyl ester carboxylesterase
MIKIKNVFFAFLLISFFQEAAHSQKLSPGPQVMTFFSDVDDTEQPYGLYLPKNFDETKKYPLVIMLHGAGSNHRLAMRRVFGKSNFNGENDVEASKYFPEFKDADYIVASPFARGTAGYQGVPEKDVWDVVADVKKRFKIDEDRMYLTGLSMGGGGTLWIGLTRPDVWAAIAPVCPAPPKGTDDLAVNALNFPLHFFHGDNDQAVPVSVSRDWVKHLKELGSSVEYKEYPGVGHNSWENAYKDNFIFDWFSQYKRNPFPDQVRFATSQYKYDKAYWVRFNAITPGKLAKIDAKFSDTNQILITANDLSAFTLKLAGHPKAKIGDPLLLIVNGKKLKTTATDSVILSLKNGKWLIEGNVMQTTGKSKGAEGPIKEAFASRHIYVYGTAGNPTEEQLKARIDSATKAANWSVYRGSFLGRIMTFPRVVADKDVRESDLTSANLILFGTRETNTMIQKFSDRLPMQLNAAATDFGLLYIFPLNGHYVAINSGLPWWTGFKERSRFSLPYLDALPGFKDYILFKNNINDVVQEGYFEKDWTLKAEDAKALKTSGVVDLKPSIN